MGTRAHRLRRECRAACLTRSLTVQESETVDAARRPGRLAGSGMNSDTRAHGERHDGDPIVTVSSGTVRGQRDGTIDRFLGIPYAAPPFGERRFAAPHPPQAWEGERDATQFGPTAPQTAYVGGLEKYLPTVAIAGDDILTLNVWVPAEQSPGGRLPVMVFVHGGAFSRGTSALPAYDGAAFAKHGIVYVSLNYRLGSEGFSVLDGVPQNLGLLDQMAAFAWVRRFEPVLAGVSPCSSGRPARSIGCGWCPPASLIASRGSP